MNYTNENLEAIRIWRYYGRRVKLYINQPEQLEAWVELDRDIEPVELQQLAGANRVKLKVVGDPMDELFTAGNYAHALDIQLAIHKGKRIEISHHLWPDMWADVQDVTTLTWWAMMDPKKTRIKE